MWCSLDSVDVDRQDKFLKYDKLLGWVHSSDDGESWHTLKGTALDVPAGKKRPADKTLLPPGLAAIVLDPELQVPLGESIDLNVPKHGDGI
jgi:hypothetical protein